MAAPIEVESDGSVRDLFKDPPFDLENVRFGVSGQVSEGDLDKETLETLYEQILRAIYDKIGVTDWYPPGQLPNCHEATVTLLMKNHRLIWTDSFTKFTGYRACDRLAKDIAGKGQDLPEDIKNLIPCPSAPVLLSYVALAIFRKPPTGSPGKDIISMFCTKKVLKWLRLAIHIYERNQSRLMYISVDDNYDLDDGRQSEFIERRGKKYLCVKSHSVDDSVFQREIDQYFNSGCSLVSDDSDNSDSGWAGLSDHGNLSGDEMGIDSQHVTSNESVQDLDSGPQSVIEADIRTLIGTIAETSAKIDAMEERLNETIAEIPAKINASIQNGAELYKQAVLGALQESDVFKTVIERAVAKLQPRISHSVDDGNNALDEDTQ
ncbi:hypothetical protein BFJ72_g1252 [Fusarium proliferatum]|uniref:Uncharacterized protein n=1 Tax=Gibberella intermedia TaxID=948311 RepID=A0A420U3P5_GIBIN|nr:hypothetical protein BFJ72_g1252 [Fusarium proliferatum]